MQDWQEYGLNRTPGNFMLETAPAFFIVGTQNHGDRSR
jgi:hypothetical protein